MTLFGRLRRDFINKRQLKKYLLYAIGEILLVMIGISLAFQLDNWNENRIKKNTELSYYKNIRDQILEDRNLILSQVDFNNGYREKFTYANEIIKLNDHIRIDTLGRIARELTQYSDFDRQGNIYETMVNSGEIKLLKNQDIVNGLRLLEEKYLYINRMENIHYDVMMTYVIPAVFPNVKFSSSEVMKVEELYNYEFENLLLSLLQIMAEKDQVYHEALREIEIITNLIDKELKS